MVTLNDAKEASRAIVDKILPVSVIYLEREDKTEFSAGLVRVVSDSMEKIGLGAKRHISPGKVVENLADTYL